MPRPYDERTLERFKSAQQTAQKVVLDVAAGLKEGDSEIAVGRRLVQRANELGADGFFHEPLVWFGERTAFFGLRSSRDAFPGEKELQPGMPVILDTAPIFDGCAVDVSHSCALGQLPLLEEGKEVLTRIRSDVLAVLEHGATAREVVHWVADCARERGWNSRQAGYLFGALAHRVFAIPRIPFRRTSLVGLGLPSAVALFGRAFLHRIPLVPVAWPFWNDDPRSGKRPVPGLWSFEPHIEREGVGVKWEELLVVNEGGGVRWLDADATV